MSFLISGFSEGGIVASSKGVWAYGSYGYGVESNISISSTLSFTVFPYMEDPLDAAGTGYSVSGNTTFMGADVSAGYVKSGEHDGMNFQVGIGAFVFPASVSAYKTETKLHPVTDKAVLSKFKSELNEALVNIENSMIQPLEKKVQKMTEDLTHQKDLLSKWEKMPEGSANPYTLEAWDSIAKRQKGYVAKLEKELEVAQGELNEVKENYEALKEIVDEVE
ncbi:hypothetical protein RCC89_09985 [Cytophagaceae bacterium ABcell3]|nr:hypothetical protein RCC89_09985 [Cytophagaceae bacterium ABcell3]